jgi:hypothetical protein
MIHQRDRIAILPGVAGRMDIFHVPGIAALENAPIRKFACEFQSDTSNPSKLG